MTEKLLAKNYNMEVFATIEFSKIVKHFAKTKPKFDKLIQAKITKMILEENYDTGNVLCGDKRTISCYKKRLTLKYGHYRLILIINISQDEMVLENIYSKSEKEDLTVQEYKKVNQKFEAYCNNQKKYLTEHTNPYPLIKI